MIAVRCPRDYDAVMQKAGGQWEPGSRQWLTERRRINPEIRTLPASPLIRCSAASEEHRRRGDAADALFHEMVRRATGKP